jgi:hypothetical protein
MKEVQRPKASKANKGNVHVGLWSDFSESEPKPPVSNISVEQGEGVLIGLEEESFTDPSHSDS